MNKKIGTIFVLKAILFALPIIIICLCFLNPLRSGRWFFSFFLIFCIVERSWEAFYTTKKQKRATIESDPTLPITVSLYIFLIIFCILEFYLVSRSPNLFISFFAFVLYLVALILRIWAVQSLGDQWSINILDKSTTNFQKKLITKGPYKYIRHPVYLGTILEQISVPILLNLYYTAGIILLCSIPFHIVKASIEEKILVSDAGLNYKEYMKNTSQFNPFYMVLKRAN